MAFDGSEGGTISVTAAVDLVGEFRDNYPEEIKGVFLGKDVLSTLLNQEGAEGLRIYFGQKASAGDFTVVVVAADCDENDMLNKIADQGVACPTNCSSTGSLR